MRTCNELVNVFFGTEVYKNPNAHGLQTKWFAYKPKIGNLSPVCGLPFTAFCAVPYSGGYPTGYGKYTDSSDSTPLPFTLHKTFKGFTHFAQSGTGFIDNFYNYFLITPGSLHTKILHEDGVPGYYHVATKGCAASVTAGGRYNVYHFENCRGKLKFYPGYAGLNYLFGLHHRNCKYTLKEIDNVVLVNADYEDVKVYYAIGFSGEVAKSKIRNGFVVEFVGNSIDFKMSYSFESEQDAQDALKNALDFEECKANAENAWENALSKIEYKGNNAGMFYSALFSAVKKPCIDGGFACRAFDFATLWDMYKTQLPLAFLLYPDESEKIVQGLEDMFLDGYFTNARLMETNLRHFCEGQAKCLAPIALATAKLYGIDIGKDAEDKVIKDVSRATSDKLIKPVIAHNFDVADGVCALVNAGITHMPIEDITERMKTIYDEFGVLISEIKDAKFYEGNKWNYSFRVGASTKERLKFTDIEKLKTALDEFFGYGKEDVKDFVIPKKIAIFRRLEEYGNSVNRFEGLNNEPDMDAPFLYHCIGEYARCDEVVALATNKFRPTPDGLCGNDDSGGLTSWYVWAAIGIYPVVGTDEFLVFKGEAQEVTLHLKNADFKIVKGDVQEPMFNGNVLVDHRIKVSEIQAGGTLVVPR